MYWHAQPTSLTLRGYATEGGYAAKREYQVVLQVELLGDREAYVHAALKADGSALSVADFSGIAKLLLAEHGVTTILSHRRGRLVEWDVPGWLSRGQAERPS